MAPFLEPPAAAASTSSSSAAAAAAAEQLPQHGIELTLRDSTLERLYAEGGAAAQVQWLTLLSTAAEPREWPGGAAPGGGGAPLPLAYPQWAAGAVAGAAAAAAAAAARSADAAAALIKSPPPPPSLALPPALASAPPWARPALLLRKLRRCSVLLSAEDAARAGADAAAKRALLLEVAAYFEGGGEGARVASERAGVLDDVLHVLRLHLFRAALPELRGGGGDAAAAAAAREDPQWLLCLEPLYRLLGELLALPRAHALHAPLTFHLLQPEFILPWARLLRASAALDAREAAALAAHSAALFERVPRARLAQLAPPHLLEGLRAAAGADARFAREVLLGRVLLARGAWPAQAVLLQVRFVQELGLALAQVQVSCSVCAGCAVGAVLLACPCGPALRSPKLFFFPPPPSTLSPHTPPTGAGGRR